MPQIKDDHDADSLRSGRRGRTFESCRPDYEGEPVVGSPLIIEGLPNDIYHRLPEPSKSPLWALRRHGPVWYYETFVARTQSPFSSASLTRGTLVHLVFELGEAEFRRRAVLAPEKYCTTTGLSAGKEAKAWLADQPADAVILTPADDAVITGIWKQAMDNAAVREIVEGIEYHELSVRVKRADGHGLRCRIDALHRDGRLIDWKTSREARPLETWVGPAIEHGYHYQAALYQSLAIEAGISDRPMTFVVLSTTPSYQVQAVTLPAHVVDMCHDLITADLDEIAYRTETDNWLPAGYGEVHELVVPDYLLRRFHV
jgi:hypothetical protein